MFTYGPYKQQLFDCLPHSQILTYYAGKGTKHILSLTQLSVPSLFCLPLMVFQALQQHADLWLLTSALPAYRKDWRFMEPVISYHSNASIALRR